MSVPDRFHIAIRNDLAAFTLATSVAAETAYPLTNMQDKIANHYTVIDMTGETTVALTGSGSDALPATCFALHNHNMPDGTTVRLRLYPDASQGGTAVYDSAETDVMHNIQFGPLIAGFDPIESNYEDGSLMKTHFSLWFDSVAYKSFQIDITNADGFTNDLLQIDKGYLAFAYCSERGPERGFDTTIIEGSEHQRKPGGGMETVQREIRRSLNLQFKGVSNSERNILRRLLDRAKYGGDLLITMDPNDAQMMRIDTTSIYRRTSTNSFSNKYYNGSDFGLSVEEN